MGLFLSCIRAFVKMLWYVSSTASLGVIKNLSSASSTRVLASIAGPWGDLEVGLDTKG
jgi:hypothetical protein